MPRRWRFSISSQDLLDGQRMLGDQDHVGAARDPAHDRDPAGVAAHHLDDHHAVVRLGGRVQPVDRLGRDRDRGVEAEGVVRSGEVVVDRLRHADDGEALLRVEPRRRRRACPRRRSRRARRAVLREVREDTADAVLDLVGVRAAVPMIVPPRGRMPEISRGPSGSSWSSTSPRQPARTPMTSWPRSSERRATARITAFSPGQSPPPVRTPTRTVGTLSAPRQAEPTYAPALRFAPVVIREKPARLPGARHAGRVRVATPVRVALRRDQHVVAHRVEQAVAERAAVRRRAPARDSAVDLPPLRLGQCSSSSSPTASSAAVRCGYSCTRHTRPSRTVTTAA